MDTRETVAIGIATIEAGLLAKLQAESYARNGVVLCNAREKFTMNIDGKPVSFTASVYVQREALTEDESTKVAASKAEKDAAKDKRETDAAEKIRREKREAFSMGQESTVSALRNIGDLTAGFQALTQLKTKGK